MTSSGSAGADEDADADGDTGTDEDAGTDEVDGTNGTGRAQATLLEDDVEFDASDAELLRAIDRTGSIAAATSELGRSRARALKRIETLETAFGELVTRQRGGSGGGGSQLTDGAASLLAGYDRLEAALSGAARVPETVLQGRCTAVDGELATVATDVGDVRALHDGVSVDDPVQVRIGADTVTLQAPQEAPEPGSTSARNRVVATVTEVDRGETVIDVHLDVDGVELRALVTETSASRLDLAPDRQVVLTWKATATRLIRVGTTD